jgi:hypothetical protein
LSRGEIDWNNTPWQEDIFDDNEDMQALRTSIVTINVALTVSYDVLSDDVFVEVLLMSLLCCDNLWQIGQRTGSTC